MNLQPTLENDLVKIRPLLKSDYDRLYKAASDPEIWILHTTTDRWLPDGFKKFFNESLESKGCLVIIDQSNQKIIGSSRYHPVADVDHAIEIGWSFLAKAYWGGQYNRAFKSLMVNHALGSVDDVLFLIAKDNIRSQRATEKLGGERLIQAEHPLYFRKAETHFTYRITQPLSDASAS